MNAASRLEGTNKSYGTQILIGEATERLARSAVITREVDSIAVYGREEEIAVYELVGLASDAGSVCRSATSIALYEQRLAKYRERNFAGAINDLQSSC